MRPALDESCRRALRDYSWPGDRDELLRIAEWLRLAHAGARVRMLDLPIAVFAEEYATRVLSGRLDQTLDGLMHEIEAEVIAMTVERTGSLRKAAKALGAGYRTLKTKLAWRRRVRESDDT